MTETDDVKEEGAPLADQYTPEEILGHAISVVANTPGGYEAVKRHFGETGPPSPGPRPPVQEEGPDDVDDDMFDVRRIVKTELEKFARHQEQVVAGVAGLVAPLVQRSNVEMVANSLGSLAERAEDAVRLWEQRIGQIEGKLTPAQAQAVGAYYKVEAIGSGRYQPETVFTPKNARDAENPLTKAEQEIEAELKRVGAYKDADQVRRIARDSERIKFPDTRDL